MIKRLKGLLSRINKNFKELFRLDEDFSSHWFFNKNKDKRLLKLYNERNQQYNVRKQFYYFLKIY